MTVDLSVVVAVYNEHPHNLVKLLERLWKAVTPLSLSYEVVFVNDGSGPVTTQALRRLAQEVGNVRVICLSRNFGQQAAISAGIANSEGAAVINIDSDLQDPPELIPQMVALWRDGNDVVFVKRSARRDQLSKRLSAFLFYRLLGLVSSIEIPWDTGDFRLLDRKVCEALSRLPEKTRFLRGLIPWLGFRQVGISVDRDAREVGESTYTLKKLICLAMDGLISFSFAPLYLVFLVGISFFLASIFVVLPIVVIGQFTTWRPDSTLVLITVVFFSALQMLSLGVVAIYLSKILDEVRCRPTYVIAERFGTLVAPATGEESVEDLIQELAVARQPIASSAESYEGRF